MKFKVFTRFMAASYKTVWSSSQACHSIRIVALLSFSVLQQDNNLRHTECERQLTLTGHILHSIASSIPHILCWTQWAENQATSAHISRNCSTRVQKMCFSDFFFSTQQWLEMFRVAMWWCLEPIALTVCYTRIWFHFHYVNRVIDKFMNIFTQNFDCNKSAFQWYKPVE